MYIMRFWSLLFVVGVVFVVNADSFLTATELVALGKNVKDELTPNIAKHGFQILMKMVTKLPDMESVFSLLHDIQMPQMPDISGISNEKLCSNFLDGIETLKDYATSTLTQFGTCVFMNMNDEDLMKGCFVNTIGNHPELVNPYVDPSIIITVLHDYMVDTLQYDGDLMSGWDKVLGVAGEAFKEVKEGKAN